MITGALNLRGLSPERAVAALRGALERPVLLNAEAFPSGRIVTDEMLRIRANDCAKAIVELELDPAPLTAFLEAHPWNGRLGRYFENLLQFYFRSLVKVERLECNLQIRSDAKRTIGELDLVFRENAARPPEHWEASVKFYLCIAETADEALDTRFFMGTLVEDRLDRKLKKLVGKQLDLALQPEAIAKLETLQLINPISRALLKGYFYYPAKNDWRKAPHPREVSAEHSRGWWTTANELDCLSPRSHYVFLHVEEWLEPLTEVAGPHELYTFLEMRARIQRFFDDSWARPVHSEAMVAEVDWVSQTSSGQTGKQIVREISRGNILHPRWPAHARRSIFPSEG